MGNFKEYISRMDSNMKYKLKILENIPDGFDGNILDFGCGSGILSRHIRALFPKATVVAYDVNENMLQVARENRSAVYYISKYKELKKFGFDIIIFSSVLHELSPQVEAIVEVKKLLKSNSPGLIIIRDGFIRDRDKDDIRTIKLRDPEEAYRFYQAAGDSLVGNLELYFSKNELHGCDIDVRNFLQTYTWGFQSLYREAHELQVIPESVYKSIEKELKPNSVDYQILTQAEYFLHLKDIADFEGTWDTHVIASYLFKGGKL